MRDITLVRAGADDDVVCFLAAALVGLGAAPLWTAKCSYLTDTGALYADAKLVHKDVVVNRFFGIFFMFFQSGSVQSSLRSIIVGVDSV